MTIDRRWQLPLFFLAASAISTSFTGPGWASMGLMSAALTSAAIVFGAAVVRHLEFQLLVGGVVCMILLKLAKLGPAGTRTTELILAAVLVTLVVAVSGKIVRALYSTSREVRSVRRSASSLKGS